MFLHFASPNRRSKWRGPSAARAGRNVVEQFAFLSLLAAVFVVNSALLHAQSGETWIDLRGNFSWCVDVEIDILHVHERTRVVDQP
jgi:hypothetical protein